MSTQHLMELADAYAEEWHYSTDKERLDQREELLNAIVEYGRERLEL